MTVSRLRLARGGVAGLCGPAPCVRQRRLPVCRRPGLHVGRRPDPARHQEPLTRLSFCCAGPSTCTCSRCININVERSSATTDNFSVMATRPWTSQLPAHSRCCTLLSQMHFRVASVALCKCRRIPVRQRLIAVVNTCCMSYVGTTQQKCCDACANTTRCT